MSNKKKWIVTTAPEGSLSEIKKNLAEAGFEVDEVFEEIGSIVARGDDDAVGRVRSIPGVADVSPEEPIDIGPPDARVTW
jgi:hypothetical protein